MKPRATFKCSACGYENDDGESRLCERCDNKKLEAVLIFPAQWLKDYADKMQPRPYGEFAVGTILQLIQATQEK